MTALWSLWSVPGLLLASWLSVLLVLWPTPRLAGLLLRASQHARGAAQVITRRRVAPRVPWLLSAVGVLSGLLSGAALASHWGWQGLLLGVGLAAVGGLGPRVWFTPEGWDARFVRAVNADALLVLQMVYLLSAVGEQPVDEAVRLFAQSWAGSSPLAAALQECSATASPVEFLEALQLPGAACALLVLALHQARETPPALRRQVLGQQLERVLTELRQELLSTAKRRAQTALIVGVVVLLPTLLLTVLAPPLFNLVGFFK